MAHHSEFPFHNHPNNRRELETGDRDVMMKKLLNTTGFVGATGLYPGGQLGEHDEGELRFKVSVIDGRLVLDFGKPVHSLGMTPQQACDLAGDLVKIARAAARKTGETVGIKI